MTLSVRVYKFRYFYVSVQIIIDVHAFDVGTCVEMFNKVIRRVAGPLNCIMNWYAHACNHTLPQRL